MHCFSPASFATDSLNPLLALFASTFPPLSHPFLRTEEPFPLVCNGVHLELISDFVPFLFFFNFQTFPLGADVALRL